MKESLKMEQNRDKHITENSNRNKIILNLQHVIKNIQTQCLQNNYLRKAIFLIKYIMYEEFVGVHKLDSRT